jgi:L-Ala-D/L-Glu epimerase / N-acetyl-D-glutamate racemase
MHEVTGPATTAERAARTGRIARITLRSLRLPLFRPYRLSYRTFTEFAPIIAEILLDDGGIGWGEGHISPGSSAETPEGGWRFALAQAKAMIGQGWQEASLQVQTEAAASPVAAGALATAGEMAGGEELLRPAAPVTLPLLTPINALEPAEIGPEVESWLEQGFRTFKVKVGKSVADDLARVRAIQAAVAGRASLRIDANRAFTRAKALAFVAGLEPRSIELFEQPCASDAWDDNAAVAAASPVPLMLDEPICSLADIARAGAIPGVGFCKVKLKRFGGLGRLRAALEAIRAHGMKAVLGDGLGTDLSCWMEACIGAELIHGAGEFNGFLKIREPLLCPPLDFAGGQLRIARGYAPAISWSAHRAAIAAEEVVE